MTKSIKKKTPHRENNTTESLQNKPCLFNFSLSEALTFMPTYHLLVDFCDGTSLIAVIKTSIF